MSETSNDMIMPHLCSEFFLWICYAAENGLGRLGIEQKRGQEKVQLEVLFWIEDRISFRNPAEEQTRAVVTGESLFQTQEAAAALSSGKMIQDLRLHLRVEEREYSLTLKSPYLDVSSLKFPEHEKTEDEALILERMWLYNEVNFALESLYQYFSELRLSKEWGKDILPKIREWVHGVDVF